MIKKQLIYLIFFLVNLFVFNKGLTQPKFTPNKGQFHTNVEFQLDHAAGRFYFQKN